MKHANRFLMLAAIAVSISVLASTTWAQRGHFGGGGRFNGGFHGRSWGGWHGGWGWGGRGWYPWGFSFVYAPYPYYYDSYYYAPAAYYAPPVYYSSQPAVVYDSSPAVYNSGSPAVYNSPPPAPEAQSPQQPAGDRPLSPTAVDRDSPPPPPSPSAQWSPQLQRNDQGSIGVADVKALAKAGLSDDVILSHLRNSGSVYHLTTADIIDLKNSGVSEKVIDVMINTPTTHR